MFYRLEPRDWLALESKPAPPRLAPVAAPAAADETGNNSADAAS